MAVPAVNITIEQGTDFENVYTVTNPDGTPLDLTGYTAAAKIIKFPGSSTTSSSFSVGIITSAGQVLVSMAHTVSSELNAGRYYYDVIITSGISGKKTKIIDGMALVTPSASI
jgi:hypothetical protein